MSTTIRVNDSTAEKLRTLKQQEGKASMNELIEDLIEHEQHRISMYGADPDLEPWSHDDRTDTHDRDR